MSGDGKLLRVFLFLRLVSWKRSKILALAISFDIVCVHSFSRYVPEERETFSGYNAKFFTTGEDKINLQKQDTYCALMFVVDFIL